MIVTGVAPPPFSATFVATLRQTVPIWRSRARTPASRVYSPAILRSAASSNVDLVDAQSVLLDLARDQVALRDLDLLLLGVGAELDDLHAVQQRLRDGVQPVRRGDEEDLAQVERHVQVVIAELGVLLRVKHLEQRR